MYVYILHCLDLCVQPIGVFGDFPKAWQAAEDITKKQRFNAELFQFRVGEDVFGIPHSVWRLLTPNNKQALTRARKLLKPFFPKENPSSEDFEKGLEYNVLPRPEALTEKQEQTLRNCGFKVEEKVLQYNFYPTYDAGKRRKAG